jgi:pimeloyl-ACP methyl ester carboxylesterase
MHKLCLLSLLVTGVMLASCDHSKNTKQTQAPTADIEVKHERVVIDYHSCGTQDTTLLFVHGWCIDQSYWADQVAAFCNDYRVVTMDLPGFGQSGRNREKWTMEEYGKDVLAVIHQLDLQNVVLIGHSMGGDVILEAALADPETVIGFVGVDNFKDVGVAYSQEEQEEINEFMAMIAQDFANVASAYAAQALFHDSTDTTVVQRVTNDFRQADSTIAIASLKALFEYGPKESEQLSRLNEKIYLINSDATPTAVAGLDEAGVNYEVADIHDTGHYPMIEKPEEFNQLLGQVLKKIQADGHED